MNEGLDEQLARNACQQNLGQEQRRIELARQEADLRRKFGPKLSEVYLRDYFAAAALQGLLATQTHEYRNNPMVAASEAYQHADAMMKERDRK